MALACPPSSPAASFRHRLRSAVPGPTSAATATTSVPMASGAAAAGIAHVLRLSMRASSTAPAALGAASASAAAATRSQQLGRDAAPSSSVTPTGATRGFAAAAASAADSAAATTSPGHGWTLTLERGVGAAYGSEAELQASGAFAAEVFPDLPIATTWQNLGKALLGGLSSSAAASPAPPFPHYTTRAGALKVITAAANLRSSGEIERRLLAAAGEEAEAGGGQRAGAVLCVSGSHPVRSLPMVSGILRSSLDTLRIASRLRAAGHIHPDTQLWVVANPNTERGAGLLEAKAALGATAVLTQPPLDWPAYLAWLQDAQRRGLLRPAPPPALPTPAASSTGAATNAGDSVAAAAAGGSSGAPGGVRLYVGHPMISSAANLVFWAALSGCARSAAAAALAEEARRAEAAGKEAAAAHMLSYNNQLVEQVVEAGGAAGLHVMPLTKAAKRMALQMLADGSLPRSAPA